MREMLKKGHREKIPREEESAVNGIRWYIRYHEV